MRALKMLGSNDCFRTAVACLLDCQSPDEVPHVYADTDDADIAITAMREFLATRNRGLAFFGTNADLTDIYEMMAATNRGVHYILIGTNRRGVNHAVVCLDDQQIHDPAWGGTGIHSPGDAGHYGIIVITAL